MSYVISPRLAPAQDVVSLRGHIAESTVPEFLQRSFRQLFGRLHLLGVPPSGAPFVIYHAFEPEIDAEVCVPVSQPVEANGLIESRHLPAVSVAQTTHFGPYEELGGAYEALQAWVRDNGFEPNGPVLERYLAGPGDPMPDSAYRTEIELPIGRAPVPQAAA